MSEKAPVLLIEDDGDVREVIREVCEAEGFEVVAAASGSEAKAHVGNGVSPCVVLLDMNLSDGDGRELGAWFRSHPSLKDVPLVVISGNPRIAEAARELAAAHLLKPFPVEKLIDAVERHCRRSRCQS